MDALEIEGLEHFLHLPLEPGFLHCHGPKMYAHTAGESTVDMDGVLAERVLPHVRKEARSPVAPGDVGWLPRQMTRQTICIL